MSLCVLPGVRFLIQTRRIWCCGDYARARLCVAICKKILVDNNRPPFVRWHLAFFMITGPVENFRWRECKPARFWPYPSAGAVGERQLRRRDRTGAARCHICQEAGTFTVCKHPHVLQDRRALTIRRACQQYIARNHGRINTGCCVSQTLYCMMLPAMSKYVVLQLSRVPSRRVDRVHTGWRYSTGNFQTHLIIQ